MVFFTIFKQIKFIDMKRIFTLVSAFVLSMTVATAQNVQDASASDAWIGYMNWFDLPDDGGAYQDGSFWEVAALKTTLDAGENTITLQPNFNTYAENPDNPYWIDPDSGEGNKQMEASTFVEPGDTFNEVDLTFKGHVISNDLAEGYTAQFFIKALDPDAGFSDALAGAKIMDLPENGYFTVSATGAELAAGLIIQYGFVVTGPNANPDNEDSLGSVVIGSASLDVEEESAIQGISIYPNPTTDFLIFNGVDQVASFNIMDLSGKVVLKGNNENKVDVSGLKPGVYFIRFEDMDKSKTIKFIKK